jgi:hypothetical protein
MQWSEEINLPQEICKELDFLQDLKLLIVTNVVLKFVAIKDFTIVEMTCVIGTCASIVLEINLIPIHNLFASTDTPWKYSHNQSQDLALVGLMSLAMVHNVVI